MTEKFQSRTLASFSRSQLERILEWSHQNGMGTFEQQGLSWMKSSEKIAQIAELDEKGNPLDEKGRKRLELACKSFAPLFSFGKMEHLVTMSVWLVSDKPPTLEFRWKQKGDFFETHASETRLLGKY